MKKADSSLEKIARTIPRVPMESIVKPAALNPDSYALSGSDAPRCCPVSVAPAMAKPLPTVNETIRTFTPML